MIKPVHGTLTSDFNEPRPWGKPTHNHGAIDIANSIGAPINAPEDGELIAYMASRSETAAKNHQGWPAGEWPQIDNKQFPFANYFYDMYGGLLILRANSGRCHVFCHAYGNHLWNTAPVQPDLTKDPYTEEKKDSRFPMFAFMSKPKKVKMGQKIGFIGNSGYSTGPHTHYEIHHGFYWEPHEKRVNPELLFNW
jgi:hypothetical protein